MNNILEIKNLNKNYQTKEKEINVLNNINIKIKDNDFIGIVGPSGSGKSTLLSIIAGLENYSSGKIIKKDNLKIGYMMQKDYLMPYLNILDNCLIGVKINKNYNKENINKAKELLTKYGLKNYIYSYPSNISGGQRQRVALIRTLMINPDIILLDEPFSALDYKTRINISCDIKNIIKENKKALILVTHNINEALNMCNKIIVLSNTPSSIKSIYNNNLNDNNYLYNRIRNDLNYD